MEKVYSNARKNNNDSVIAVPNVKRVSTRISMHSIDNGVVVQEVVIVEVDRGEGAILNSIIALAIVVIGMYIISFFWKKYSKRTYTLASTAILLFFPLASSLVARSKIFPFVWLVVALLHLIFHGDIILGRRPQIVGTNIYVAYRYIFQTSISLFGIGYVLLAYGFFWQKRFLCAKGVLLLMYVLYYSLICRMGLDFISYRAAGTILPSRGIKNSGECPLCKKKTDSPQIELSCGETFHLSCIKNWKILGKKDTCPSCRERVDLSAVVMNPWQKNEYFFTQFLDFTGHLILSYAVAQGLIFFLRL